MSKCSHVSAAVTKRLRKSAHTIDPAKPPVATLLMSATLESSICHRGAQRQTPERVVLRPPVARHVSRERIVIGIERRKVRTERSARGARQRAHVDKDLRRLLVRERQRVGQNEAPSASVFRLDPQPVAGAIDVEGRNAAPEIAFSTAGINTEAAD